MNEVAKLNMVVEFWKHADEGLRSEFERMRTGFNFYVGNQWDQADLEKLNSEKRPALTINMILPIINLLAGIQRALQLLKVSLPPAATETMWWACHLRAVKGLLQRPLCVQA
jgi:hypothetical protein